MIITEETFMNILIGVTGGIAAYKSCELVRRLRDAGHEVRVMMTQSAQTFVSAMTFQALSANSVSTELFDPEQEYAMGHIGLARWADKIVIVPASANVIAKLAYGMADDLLTTVCLATDAPITVVPSMNRLMWSNTATQENVSKLKSRGFEFLGPVAGAQACGETGEGRMMDVVDILQALQLLQSDKGRVLITAGPTAEAIDPVRVLSNRSTGKMGYALANAFQKAGFSVTLVSGPTALQSPKGVELIAVETTAQMYQAVESHICNQDLFISSAAVCDYKPETAFQQKIKKKDDSLTLKLTPTIDILKTISSDNPELFTVGFALESEMVEANAKDKLARKKLNMIIANQVETALGRDDATVTVITPEQKTHLPMQAKETLASELVKIILEQYQQTKELKDAKEHTTESA